MTTIKNINNTYLADIETVDGVKHVTLSYVQLMALASELHRYCQVSYAGED
jgi:hypothetical protein